MSFERLLACVPPGVVESYERKCAPGVRLSDVLAEWRRSEEALQNAMKAEERLSLARYVPIAVLMGALIAMSRSVPRSIVMTAAGAAAVASFAASYRLRRRLGTAIADAQRSIEVATAAADAFRDKLAELDTWNGRRADPRDLTPEQIRAQLVGYAGDVLRYKSDLRKAGRPATDRSGSATQPIESIQSDIAYFRDKIRRTLAASRDLSVFGAGPGPTERDILRLARERMRATKAK